MTFFQELNRLAKQMDDHSFAGPGVATTILWCNCGAPWDLEATPNLAALIADAGFDWPPPSPIRFPLIPLLGLNISSLSDH